jgi:hypothetical protein
MVKSETQAGQELGPFLKNIMEHLGAR